MDEDHVKDEYFWELPLQERSMLLLDFHDSIAHLLPSVEPRYQSNHIYHRVLRLEFRAFFFLLPLIASLIALYFVDAIVPAGTSDTELGVTLHFVPVSIESFAQSHALSLLLLSSAFGFTYFLFLVGTKKREMSTRYLLAAWETALSENEDVVAMWHGRQYHAERLVYE
jgi:hypothetical protein